MNHLDFNGFNNNIQNLEWCSHRQNILHALGKPVVLTKDDYRQEFESISKAADHLKLNESYLRSFIGKRKTISGYEINYVDKEDN